MCSRQTEPLTVQSNTSLLSVFCVPAQARHRGHGSEPARPAWPLSSRAYGSHAPKVFRSCFGPSCALHPESWPQPTPLSLHSDHFWIDLSSSAHNFMLPPPWSLFWLPHCKWPFCLWTSIMLCPSLVWPLTIFLIVLWLCMLITSLIADVDFLGWTSHSSTTNRPSAMCIVNIQEMYIMQMNMWMTWLWYNKKPNINTEKQKQRYEGRGGECTPLGERAGKN